MTYRTALVVLALTAQTPVAATAQWALKPDPPAETVDWPVDLKPDLPTWRWPASLVLADQGGPFAAVGGFDDKWTVYDLRTSKPVGTVDLGGNAHRVALSRDGARLAGMVPVRDLKYDAVVGDTTTGKEIRRVRVRALPTDFRFTSRDRLAAVFYMPGVGQTDDRGVRFVDVAAGTEGALLPGKLGEGRAVSPGGRYVAVANPERVFVISAADETVAARLAVPVADSAGPGGPRPYRVCSLAFSPDGSKLGGVFNDFFKMGTRVFWWDLATGVRGGGYKLADTVLYGGRFEWSADGKALFVLDQTVLDPESGKVLWKLPTGPAIAGGVSRRLLSADRVLSAEQVNENATEYRLVVRTRP